jgi:hypothetical protein
VVRPVRLGPFAVLCLLAGGCWERYTFEDDALPASAMGTLDGGSDPIEAGLATIDSSALDLPAVDSPPSPDVSPALDSSVDPVVGGISGVEVRPAQVSVLASGGTAILEVALHGRAPAGGFAVALSSSSEAMVVPKSVIVPEGASAVGIRIRATGPAGSAELSASITGRNPAMARTIVTFVGTAPPPTAGELVVNEVNYDVPTINGDANCDGEVGAFPDEFIELGNLSSHPIDLTGVSLWDEFGFTGNKPRFSFPAFVLGPGEAVVVFGGALGATGTAPWCEGLRPGWIGDAAAFGNPAGFNLDNAGDTVHVTAGAGSDSPALVDPLVLPPGGNQSYTRGPDFVGAFTRHTEVPGHAPDRKWTPGTLMTGAPFAAASP